MGTMRRSLTATITAMNSMPSFFRSNFDSTARERRAAIRRSVDLSGDGYLRLDEVLAVYPVSRAAWYDGIAAGYYPPSTQLGKRTVGWSRESIRRLIANPPKF